MGILASCQPPTDWSLLGTVMYCSTRYCNQNNPSINIMSMDHIAKYRQNYTKSGTVGQGPNATKSETCSGILWNLACVAGPPRNMHPACLQPWLAPLARHCQEKWKSTKCFGATCQQEPLSKRNWVQQTSELSLFQGWPVLSWYIVVFN